MLRYSSHKCMELLTHCHVHCLSLFPCVASQCPVWPSVAQCFPGVVRSEMTQPGVCLSGAVSSQRGLKYRSSASESSHLSTQHPVCPPTGAGAAIIRHQAGLAGIILLSVSRGLTTTGYCGDKTITTFNNNSLFNNRRQHDVNL